MTPFVATVSNFLAIATVAIDIAIAAFLFILATPLSRTSWGKPLVSFVHDRALVLAFLAVLGGVAGSLFYSNIAGFAPCELCWWQRIFLYPQTVLLLVALARKDAAVRVHAVALSAIGALVALYHTFIQFGGPSIVPCSATGPSCTHLYFLYYGYVTVPTMSLTVFAAILLVFLAPKRSTPAQEASRT